MKSSGMLGVGVALGAVIVWIVVVTLTGVGVNVLGIDWDFSVTGALGDSFGVLSSGMAGIAAYFAYGTYKAAQDEGRIAERRAFEASFLNLVERRFDVLDRVRVTSKTDTGGFVRTRDFVGQEALDKACQSLNEAVRLSMTFHDAYYYAVSDIRGLSSYFRFTYHIIALIDRNLPQNGEGHVEKDSQAYQLIRLLRAQMTDSELLLLAMNCAVGSGYGKLMPLVEKYAILHNIPEGDKKLFRLDEFFAASAFGLSKTDRTSRSDTPPQDWLDAMYIDGDL